MNQSLIKIYKEEGGRGFYSGMRAHILRVVPNAAILFLMVEVITTKNQVACSRYRKFGGIVETVILQIQSVMGHREYHPHVLAKVRPHKILPECMTGKLQASTMEDLEKIPYLKAVFKESLLLFMTAAHRTTMRSTNLFEGTFVPIGSNLIMSIYAASRLKSVWGELDTGNLKSISPLQFITFGVGSHRFVGMQFALVQMETVLAVLFSQFDIKTVEDPFKITYEPSVILPVKGPLECTVHDLRAPAF
ncbi:hypothetical protein PsorP6_017431 [Peronosclerospora sorghi]|uniref:Uncharacterized protein n=1 Tax=Peronosclerospora sorghi TaxID=230839 RepID=A0ACC0WLZ6_9STRA|nr:hypothetical protein PsorP6_017431 [Peronosclerospora sorghi]